MNDDDLDQEIRDRVLERIERIRRHKAAMKRIRADLERRRRLGLTRRNARKLARLEESGTESRPGEAGPAPQKGTAPW